ncbi:acetyl-CoA carboxylase biotin carboxyl carrier protein [Actinomadura sp. 9N407]|uniref:acetyl-CoA carboxylase biotin carboxyl carrier protein n=1 Tax=Actinomadura sp. 9N407 TaxID=3375154 RepID=UPI0037AA5C33
MTEPRNTRPTLDALCRNVLELLDTSHGTPARLRVEAEGMAVEVEWPTMASLPAAVPPSGPRLNGAVRDEPDSGFTIVAPTVGTFYRAPEPGAAPFVQVGEKVEPGRQVGIVEVMKLMIPVETDRGGRVAELLVPDGAQVEHGQPLIVLADGDRDGAAATRREGG